MFTYVTYVTYVTGETRHPHHNVSKHEAKIPYSNTIYNKTINQTMHMLQKIVQGAAPKREKIANSRFLQYIQHEHLKMADWGRNM
jgi:hypothetical protein